MLSFLLSRVFWVNVVLAIIFCAVLVFGVFFYLDSYTDHGEVVSVPNVTGFEITEIEPLFKKKDLRYTVVDSSYFSDVKPGVVVEQDPKGEELVKKNRQVYLTVSSHLPPTVKMPNLIDLTLPLAMAKLNAAGLIAGELHYKPSDCVNCILGMEVSKKPIVPGSNLPKGSVVSLIVGEGNTGETVPVPNVIGMTLQETTQTLAEHGLNIGAAPCNDCITKRDSVMAKVFRQEPPATETNQIRLGGSVSVFLSIDPEKSNATEEKGTP